MKKLIGIAIVLALLSFAMSAEAAVGYKKDGEHQGAATDIDVVNGFTSFDGKTLSVFASGYAAGVTNAVTQSVSSESHFTSAALAYGVIAVSNHGSGITSKRISLADGSPGQQITVILLAYSSTTAFSLIITDDGDPQLPIRKTGWDDIAFDTALDSVTLLYVDDVVGWIIVGINGVVIT